MRCPRCDIHEVLGPFRECDRCINELCTPYEDMPQGYKDGVKIAAQKLSDSVDEHIMNMILKGEVI